MSRPVTIEELRLWADTFDGAMRNCVVEQGDTRRLHQIVTDAAWAAHNALAALPAEQEQAAASEPSSAVPELPPGAADVAYFYLSSPGDVQLACIPNAPLPTARQALDFVMLVKTSDYRALRAAAESLRERLVEALRERDAVRAALNRADERADACFARQQAAEAERDEARALAWEQAERACQADDLAAVWENTTTLALRGRDAAIARAEQAEAARDEARALAGKDCSFTSMYWKKRAEKLERDVRGLSAESAYLSDVTAIREDDVRETVARLREAEAERDALRSQLDQAARQEPVAWWLCRADGHEGGGFYLTQPESRKALPLYTAPVLAADVAQQIAAAEQRGRAAAFVEVAAECESRQSGWPHDAATAAGFVAAWCRTKAEEARG